MKKVLFMVDGLGFGGSQRYVIDLAKFSWKFDVLPYVCSFEKGDEVKDELLKANIPILVVPVKKIYTKNALMALMAIKKFIKENQIEIIHTFQTNPNILGTLAGRYAGIPVITSRRDTGELGMRGSWRVVLFENLIINKLARKIVANSKAALNSAKKNERIPEEKLILIYNGIDFLRYSDFSCDYRKKIRSDLNLTEDVCVFGNVAVHRNVKSLDNLIKAFHKVHSLHPATYLLLVGDGPERRYLEELARSLKIDGSILFTGTNLDVSKILPAMDIFVLSSKSESFSNAILEAMAAGLPVIATNVGGNSESVVHDHTGLLVEGENPDALAKAMIDLLMNPQERKKMGNEGQERIKKYFSWESAITELKDLYNHKINN